MNLKIECQGRSFLLVPGKTYIVGRHPACDIVLHDSKVSRRHLEIRCAREVWMVTDLSSTNGSYVYGQVIATCKVVREMRIVVGGRRGVELVLVPDNIEPTLTGGPTGDPTADGPSAGPIPNIPLDKSPFYIGRDAANDWVIDDLLVSRKHAEIRRAAAGHWEIVDSNSSNGTFVNGKRLPKQTPVRLNANDMVAIGRVVMRFTGEALAAPDAGVGIELVAYRVSMQRGQAQLLQNVSFRLAPRSLTAVIGPSGAGKSTLLGTLTGQMPPTSGSVFVAGRDLYMFLAELRNRIGLVPQQDLLHTNLTIQQALEFGAALRFPRDTTAAERRVRVREVLNELELQERAQQRIDTLSGGQKKRTNVALELLTKPALLFLDEPTSGLDPGLDRQVMNLLRDLADNGQTVVVVTHAMDHLSDCDNIVILGVGGVLAYYGPPAGVFDYFGTTSWAGVFGKLNQPHPWTASKPHIASTVQRLAPIRQQSWWFQVAMLVQRYVKVILADTYYVVMLAVLPLIMAAVGFISGDEFGLGAGAAVEGLPNRNLYARSLLLLLVLGAAFMGAAASILELVKERAIYERERSVGVSNSAYLASKVIVLGVITALQAALFAWLALLGRAGPQAPLIFSSGYLEIVIVVMALAVVSMAAGLVLSALIVTGEAAMPALVVFTMTQVVLSGAIQLRYAWMLDGPARLDPAYWAMNAMSASADLNVLSGLHGAERFAWWVHSAAGWQGSMLHLATMFAALLGAALWRLHHNEQKS